MFEIILVGIIAFVVYKIWQWRSAESSISITTPPPSESHYIDNLIYADDPLDADDWTDPREMLPSRPRPIKATLLLNYRDAQGSTSERHVDAKECDTSNPSGYLIGFCHLRQAIRTFRIDRIVRAVDAETGEIIHDLPTFAAQRYAESPIATIDTLLSDAADAVRALFYIGKADGRFTKKEKEVFLAYCREATGDDRLTLKNIDDLCNNLDIPSKQAFKLICGRLAKLDTRQRLAILDATEKMIATEKTISEEETEALKYMTTRLAVTEMET